MTAVTAVGSCRGRLRGVGDSGTVIGDREILSGKTYLGGLGSTSCFMTPFSDDILPEESLVLLHCRRRGRTRRKRGGEFLVEELAANSRNSTSPDHLTQLLHQLYQSSLAG